MKWWTPSTGLTQPHSNIWSDTCCAHLKPTSRGLNSLRLESWLSSVLACWHSLPGCLPIHMSARLDLELHTSHFLCSDPSLAFCFTAELCISDPSSSFLPVLVCSLSEKKTLSPLPNPSEIHCSILIHFYSMRLTYAYICVYCVLCQTLVNISN